MQLKNRTALITGGTSGIGLATASLFSQQGARVAITGRDATKLEQAKRRLGDSVIVINADVQSAADLQKIRLVVDETFGGLDIFFANAGAAFPTPLAETTEARYDELMNINVKGVFFSMQAVLPVLRDGASVILNTSWLNEVGAAGMSVLSASKAAVRSFARTWSRELLPRKIRVNAVSPGAIDTPIHGITGNEKVESAKKQLATHIPLGHLGEPTDIAQAVLFLASDASRYMLGAEVVVDGGFAQL